MDTTIRRCEYCHKSIDNRGPKAKTCGNTCKQYAMEVRQGKCTAIPRPNLTPEPKPQEGKIDRTKLEDQLAAIEKAVTESNKNLIQIEKTSGLGDEEGDKLIMENFRLREAKNDFLNKHFLNSDGIAGSELLKYSTGIIRYPFEKIGHFFLENMGTPPQPFIATIKGGANTGKTILGVLISVNLTNYLGSKILHVLDFENKAKAIDYYRRTKANLKNVSIKYEASYNNIVDALKKEEYEFLILDSIQGLKLNYKDLIPLRKLHPKLSIFCVIKGTNKSILDASNITFETELHRAPEDIRAYANITGEGVIEDKNGVSIFRIDVLDGFTIG